MKEDNQSFEIQELSKQIDLKSKVIIELKSKEEQFEKERILFMEDSTKIEKLHQMGLIDNKGYPLQLNSDQNTNIN